MDRRWGHWNRIGLHTAVGLMVALALCMFVDCGVSSAPAGHGASGDRLDAVMIECESVAWGVRMWLVDYASLGADAVDALARDAETRFTATLAALRRGAATVENARVGVRVYRAGAWRELATTERVPDEIVLLVHGLDEPGDIWDDLAPALADAGHTPVRFDYPNDQAIARSADLLAAALTGLKAHGARRVSIIAHSMGGLVARDTLTRTMYYNSAADQPDKAALPDVPRLILCGTPNTGSPVASLRLLAELREQILRLAGSGFDPDELLGFVADGAGEAGRDLAVGSAFLNDLNARPLPANVTITCVVAEMAPIKTNRLDDLLESRWAQRWLGATAEALAADLRAAAASIGDGVVPVASARLIGVDDVARVHANHRTMLLTLDAERLLTPLTGAPADPPAIRVILDRLSAE